MKLLLLIAAVAVLAAGAVIARWRGAGEDDAEPYREADDGIAPMDPWLVGLLG